MDAGPIVAALLIHGAGGGAWEWDIWRAVFAARGLDPLCPDLGHRRKDWPRPLSMITCARHGRRWHH